MNPLRDLNDTVEECCDYNKLSVYEECGDSKEFFAELITENCMDGFNYSWTAKEVLAAIQQIDYVHKQEGLSSFIDNIGDLNLNNLLTIYASDYIIRNDLVEYYFNEAKKEFEDKDVVSA